MKKSFKKGASTLDFKDSFIEEIEAFGRFGFYEMDLIGGTLKASLNFKKLFCLPEKDLLEIREYQALIHPEDFSWVMEAYNACKLEKRNFESVYRVIIQGDVRYIRGQSIFISDQSGKPIKVIGMKQDISHEKLAEIERKKYIKDLELAHEQTTTIVHDLKAPIINMNMIADLLKGNVSQEMESLIDMIQNACQRAYEIIDDVLERGVTAGGVNSKTKVWVDMHLPISNAVSTLYYIAQKKDIKILTSFQPDTYAHIYPQKLQRALENLLSNAIKFSHRNTQIEVSLSGKDQAILIKIEDFGLGMNEQQKGMLFLTGNSSGRMGTEGEKSSGLGLGIVKKIVDQHSGKIWFESEEGKGTAFYIELPKE